MTVDIETGRKERLNGIDALRCIAFLMVFISHCGIELPIGEGGVSLFLVISGFVSVYSNISKKTHFNPSFKNNLLFAINRIKSLYFLHVICTLLMAIRLLLGDSEISVNFLIVKIILNLLLIQEWLPLANASVNGVSWYLCVMLLFYFVYPCIEKYFRNGLSIYKAKRNILIFVICIFIISVGSKIISDNISLGNEILFRSNICHWIVYYYPPVRLLEVLIGCNLAYVYLNKTGNRKSVLEWTLFELVAVFLLIFSNCLYLNYIKIPSVGIFNSSETWWKDSLNYVIPSLTSVYVFAVRRGIITSLLDNGVVRYISSLSRDGFLIHFVVIQYLYSIAGRVEFLKFLIENNFLKVSLFAAVTLISCEIWRIVLELIKNTKRTG